MVTCVVSEQESPGRLGQHAERDLLLPRRCLQTGGGVRGKHSLFLAVLFIGTYRLGRVFTGKRYGKLEAFEPVLPIFFCPGQILPAYPGNVITIGPAGHHLKERSCASGFISLYQLLKDQGHVPAIEKKMMRTPNECKPASHNLNDREA